MLLLAMLGCGVGSHRSNSQSSNASTQSLGGQNLLVADVVAGKYGNRLQRIMQLPDWTNPAVEKTDVYKMEPPTSADLEFSTNGSKVQKIVPRGLIIGDGSRNTSMPPFPYVGWTALNPNGMGLVKSDYTTSNPPTIGLGRYRNITYGSKVLDATDVGRYIGPDVSQGTPPAAGDPTIQYIYSRLYQPEYASDTSTSPPTFSGAPPFGVDNLNSLGVATPDGIEDIIYTTPIPLASQYNASFVARYDPENVSNPFINKSNYGVKNPTGAHVIGQTFRTGTGNGAYGEVSYVRDAPDDDPFTIGYQDYYIVHDLDRNQFNVHRNQPVAREVFDRMWECLNTQVFPAELNKSGSPLEDLFYSDILMAPVNDYNDVDLDGSVDPITTTHNPEYEGAHRNFKTTAQVQYFYRDPDKFSYLRWNYMVKITDSAMPEIKRISEGKDPRTGNPGYPSTFPVIGGIAFAWELYGKYARINETAKPWDSALGFPVTRMQKDTGALADNNRRDKAGSPRFYIQYSQYFEGGLIRWYDYLDGPDAADIYVFSNSNIYLAEGKYLLSNLNYSNIKDQITRRIEFGYGGNTYMGLYAAFNTDLGFNEYGNLKWNPSSSAPMIAIAMPYGSTGEYSDVIWNWGDGTITYNGGGDHSGNTGYAGAGTVANFSTRVITRKSFLGSGIYRPQVMVFEKNNANLTPLDDPTQEDMFNDLRFSLYRSNYTIITGGAGTGGARSGIAVLRATTNRPGGIQNRTPDSLVSRISTDLTNAGYLFNPASDVINGETLTTTDATGVLRNYKMIIWLIPSGQNNCTTMTPGDITIADNQMKTLGIWLQLTGARSVMTIGESQYGNYRTREFPINSAGRTATQWTDFDWDYGVSGMSSNNTLSVSYSSFTTQPILMSGNILNDYLPILPDPGPHDSPFVGPASAYNNAVYWNPNSQTVDICHSANCSWGPYDYYLSFFDGADYYYTGGMRTSLILDYSKGAIKLGANKKGTFIGMDWALLSYNGSAITDTNKMANVLTRFIVAADSTLQPGSTNSTAFTEDDPTTDMSGLNPAPASVKILNAYAWSYTKDGDTRKGGSGRDILSPSAGNFTDDVVKLDVSPGTDPRQITFEVWFRASKDDIFNGNTTQYMYWFFTSSQIRANDGSLIEYDPRLLGNVATRGYSNFGRLSTYIGSPVLGNIDLENNGFTSWDGTGLSPDGVSNWNTYLGYTPTADDDIGQYSFVRAEVGRPVSLPLAGVNPMGNYDGDANPYNDSLAFKLAAGDYHPCRTYVRNTILGVQYRIYSKNRDELNYPADLLNAQNLWGSDKLSVPGGLLTDTQRITSSTGGYNWYYIVNGNPATPGVTTYGPGNQLYEFAGAIYKVGGAPNPWLTDGGTSDPAGSYTTGTTLDITWIADDGDPESDGGYKGTDPAHNGVTAGNEFVVMWYIDYLFPTRQLIGTSVLNKAQSGVVQTTSFDLINAATVPNNSMQIPLGTWKITGIMYDDATGDPLVGGDDNDNLNMNARYTWPINNSGSYSINPPAPAFKALLIDRGNIVSVNQLESDINNVFGSPVCTKVDYNLLKAADFTGMDVAFYVTPFGQGAWMDPARGALLQNYWSTGGNVVINGWFTTGNLSASGFTGFTCDTPFNLSYGNSPTYDTTVTNPSLTAIDVINNGPGGSILSTTYPIFSGDFASPLPLPYGRGYRLNNYTSWGKMAIRKPGLLGAPIGAGRCIQWQDVWQVNMGVNRGSGNEFSQAARSALIANVLKSVTNNNPNIPIGPY